jgi:hypothetical protein
MSVNSGAGEAQTDSTDPEVMASQVCALVYGNGKMGGRFLMTLDDLRMKSQLTPADMEAGLSFAERLDWVRQSHSGVVLKAAGIFVAKRVLDLPR